MPDTPTPKSDDIVPLLRLGLEDDADSAAMTEHATMRVDAPTPLSGAPSPPRGWDPPSVEQLQQMLPQYDVTNFIARGGMGAVYKGQQKALKRPVAIKVLPPDIEDGDLQFSERFKHEAQAMAQVSHPNIVAVFDAGETADGLLYFVMEYIEGTDVAQLISSEGVLEPQRAIDITVAVCEALAFAHEEGIVHRDIKPSNIMIDRRGRVKVADFGLAKSVNLEATLLTGTNVAMGTPDFIAPEAMIPGMKIDQRADIYAVGVMLYQMLTGKIPRGRFELPSGVIPKMDQRFDPIVDKAMQTDREKRYSTAIEIKTDVEKIRNTSVPQLSPRSGTGSVLAPKATGLGKSRSLSKPLFIGVVAVAVVAVAVVVAGTLFALKKPAVIDAASSLSPTSGAKIEEEKWERMWNEPRENKGESKFDVEDGWLAFKTDGPPGGTLLFPKTWRDGAIRCEWRWAEGSANSHISVRQSGVSRSTSRYTLLRTKNSIRLYRSLSSEHNKVLDDYPINGPKIGDIFTLELRAVGTTLTAKLDGREIIRVEDTELAAGGPALYLYGDAGMRNIEVLNLDDTGPAAFVSPSPNTKDVPSSSAIELPKEWIDGTQALREAGIKAGRLKEENGWLSTTQQDYFFRLNEGRESEDMAVRFVFDGTIGAHLRKQFSMGNLSGYISEVAGKQAKLVVKQPGHPDRLSAVVLPPAPSGQKEREMTFVVRGSVISLWVDGKVVNFIRDEQFKLGSMDMRLYAANKDTTATRLLKVEYAILAPSSPGKMDASSSSAIELPKEWIDGTEALREAGIKAGRLKEENGWLSATQGHYFFHLDSGREREDFAVRVIFSDWIGMKLRKQNEAAKHAGYMAEVAGSQAKIIAGEDSKAERRSVVDLPKPQEQQEREMIFVVRGNEMSQWVDGKLVNTFKDEAYQRGMMELGIFSATNDASTRTRLRKVEYAILK